MQKTTDPDASPVTDDFIDALATVQTSVVDAMSELSTMLERSAPEIEEMVRDYHNTHERHDLELSARLAALGKEPDLARSSSSKVQKAVVGLHAEVDSVGDNVLLQVLSGEERILDTYRGASVAAGIVTDRDMLETQMADLERLNAHARAAAPGLQR